MHITDIMELKDSVITIYLILLILFTALVSVNLMKNVIKIGSVKMDEVDYYFILLICGYSLVQTLIGNVPVLIARFLKDGIATSKYLCDLDGFVTFCAVSCVINAIALWSNSRWFTPQQKSTVVSLHWIFPALTLWGVLLTSLPFLGIGKYEEHGDKLYCCLNWTSSSLIDRCYFYALLFFVFVLPVVMMVVGYLESKSSANTASHDKQNLLAKTNPCSTLSSTKVKALCGIVIMSLWLPYGCYVIYQLIAGDHKIVDVEIATMLVALSSSFVVPSCLHFWLDSFVLYC